MRVTQPPKDPSQRYNRTEVELGSMVRDVTIPAGAAGEEFDLGTLEMEIKGSKVTPGQAVAFQATTLDGKPFNIETVRNRPCVVMFWADWAPQSKVALEALRAVQADPKTRDVTFVTVNLDEDVNTARTAVQDLKSAIHTRLEGRARVEVTEQLGVNALPTTLLMDGQGRVFGRDVESGRLKSAVERLVKKMAKK